MAYFRTQCWTRVQLSGEKKDKQIKSKVLQNPSIKVSTYFFIQLLLYAPGCRQKAKYL